MNRTHYRQLVNRFQQKHYTTPFPDTEPATALTLALFFWSVLHDGTTPEYLQEVTP